MSNDIKFKWQGVLARAACSSGGANVAQAYPERRVHPDRGRNRPACPDQGREGRKIFRAFCVPTSLSGRPAAVNFSRPARPQLAARDMAQECRILRSTPTRLNRQTPIYRTHRKSQKTKDRHSLKSPKNANIEAGDHRYFPTNFGGVSPPQIFKKASLPRVRACRVGPPARAFRPPPQPWRASLSGC